jgi:hypothetical protein
MIFKKYDYIQKRDTNLKNDLTLKHLYNHLIKKSYE